MQNNDQTSKMVAASGIPLDKNLTEDAYQGLARGAGRDSPSAQEWPGSMPSGPLAVREKSPVGGAGFA